MLAGQKYHDYVTQVDGRHILTRCLKMHLPPRKTLESLMTDIKRKVKAEQGNIYL